MEYKNFYENIDKTELMIDLHTTVTRFDHLAPAQRMIFLVLWSFLGADGFIRCSISDIAKLTGYTQSTIFSSIKKVGDFGLLELINFSSNAKRQNILKYRIYSNEERYLDALKKEKEAKKIISFNAHEIVKNKSKIFC